MQAIALALPLGPGKADEHILFLASFSSAERKRYEDSRRALGIKREIVWHQPVSNGSIAIVFLEADDIAKAINGLVESEEPFDMQYRQILHRVHNLDPAMLTAPQQVFEARIS